MYWISFISLVLTLHHALGAAAASPACSSSPYKPFLILSTYAPALNYCTSKFPNPGGCSTTIVKTRTETAHITKASSTFTATTTTGSPATSTVTSTITPPALATSTDTETDTETVFTSTTTVLNNQKRNAAVTSSQCSSAYLSLTKAAASFVKTVCSCIESAPPCYATSTATRTVCVTTTATVTGKSVASTTTTLANTQTSTITVLTTAIPAPVTTITTTTTTTTSAIATQSVINAPRCDPATAHAGSFENGGCQNECYCNADADISFAYCVDDNGSFDACSSDADCPTGEFCDVSIGGVCDSGLSCTSTYIAPGPAKRHLFGLASVFRSARLQKKSVNLDGPNALAFKENSTLAL